MSLTYGGVSLCVPKPRTLEWIERNISTADVFEFARPVALVAGLVSWKIPSLRDAIRPIKINRLYWPRGASRWAVGHFLATDSQLEAIRRQVYGGQSYRSLPFVMAEGQSTTQRIQTNLFMLPPRPLQQLVGVNSKQAEGLWLLTLVDDRFFWWERAATITVPATWAAFYTAIGAALGVTIQPDAIDSAYLTPDAALQSAANAIPLLLDTVASRLGQRIVRGLDGTVKAQVPDQARAAFLAQSLAPRQAGGRFLFDVNSRPNDLNALAPKQVAVEFPRLDSGVGAGLVYAVTVTLASLNLSDYRGVGTRDTTKPIRSAQPATFIGDVTPTNLSDLNTLAQATARDWYKWQLAPLDWKAAGVLPWRPEGYHDNVEWSYNAGHNATRIQRGEWEIEDAGAAPGLPENASFKNLYVTESLTLTDAQVFSNGTTWNFNSSSTVNFFGTTVNVTGGTWTYNNVVIVWGPTTTQIYNGGVVFNDGITWGSPVQTRFATGACPINKTATTTVSMATTINSGTLADLSGSSLTFTLAAAAVCLLSADIDWDCASSTVGAFFEADIIVDTVAQTGVIPVGVTSTNQRGMGSRSWTTASLAAGSHTIKLQAKRTSGSGSISCGVNTCWTIHAETQINVETRAVALPNGTQLGSVSCTAVNTCCPGSGSGSGGASPCTHDPATWAITLAAFGTCHGCDVNGSYTLTQVEPSVWTATGGAGSCLFLQLTVTTNGLGQVEAILEGFVLVGSVYVVAFQYSEVLGDTAPADCCAAATLQRDFADCAPVPADLVPTTCCPDSAGWAQSISLTYTVTPGGVPDYSCVNGTYTLTYDGADTANPHPEGTWKYSGATMGGACAGGTLAITFYCNRPGGGAATQVKCTIALTVAAVLVFEDIFTVSVPTGDCDDNVFDGLGVHGTFEIVTDSGSSDLTSPAHVIATPSGGDCPDVPGVCDCSECPDGAPPEWAFVFEGGTGFLEGANGSWTVTHTSGCTWTGTLNDNTATLTKAGGIWQLTIENDDGGATWILETADCCGPLPLAVDEVAGDGDAPASLTLVGVGECGPCIATACCPDDLAPATLYLTISSCCGLAADTPMTWNASGPNGAGWYTATFACNGHTVYFQLQCNVDGAAWTLREFCSGVGIGSGNGLTVQCSPLIVQNAIGGFAPSLVCCTDGGLTWIIKANP